jgi:hypothetical protein
MEITSLLWKKIPVEIFNNNILPFIYTFEHLSSHKIRKQKIKNVKSIVVLTAFLRL